ncbi:MAG: response regulator [Candidatus Marinimicrobia bacterium]|nr:response regulator [Candidatus Neomarinimicrobiota bacterium]
MKKSKILIVDDEKNVCSFLVEFLHFKGFDADYALSGDEAIKKLSHDTFDLILLDLIMPKISGFDVLRYLQENRFDIPVIVLTGVRDEKALISTRELGAKDYITKPIDLEKLENSIILNINRVNKKVVD